MMFSVAGLSLDLSGEWTVARGVVVAPALSLNSDRFTLCVKTIRTTHAMQGRRPFNRQGENCDPSQLIY